MAYALRAELRAATRWFGEAPRTIERWVRAVERQGADGLCDKQRLGRRSRLTSEQQSQLAVDLRAGPQRCGYPLTHGSGKLISRHVERRFGIVTSPRNCLRYLRVATTAGNAGLPNASRQRDRSDRHPMAAPVADGA